MAQYAIAVHGYQWATFATQAEAIACRNAMSINNRWWKEGARVVEITADQNGRDTPATDPYKRWWQCTWIPGRAGWDLVPIEPHYRGECVAQNDRSGQSAIVTAPTATLAQERAIFMLMEKKR